MNDMAALVTNNNFLEDAKFFMFMFHLFKLCNLGHTHLDRYHPSYFEQGKSIAFLLTDLLFGNITYI